MKQCVENVTNSDKNHTYEVKHALECKDKTDFKDKLKWNNHILYRRMYPLIFKQSGASGMGPGQQNREQRFQKSVLTDKLAFCWLRHLNVYLHIISKSLHQFGMRSFRNHCTSQLIQGCHAQTLEPGK